MSDPALLREWDELADAQGASPFARPDWFQAWARAFGPRVDVVAVGEGALEAVAPVVRRSGGVFAPVNEETPQYTLLATTPSARARLVEALLAPGSAQLTKVADEDIVAVGSAAGRHRVRIETMQLSPYIDVETDWETYEKTLRAKWRKELRRTGRRLQELGEVGVEMHNGLTGLAGLLEECFRVESLQWKGRKGTAIASRPRTKAFYEEIAARAAERGWLRLWLLRLDGDAIAFALDLVVADAYYGLKVGYDPERSRLSPGILLQDDTVRYSFENGLRRFEFLGADEPYKLNWTKTCRRLSSVHAFARDLRGTAWWLKRTVLRPAVKKLRGDAAPEARSSASAR